jgi:hypothetical protein
MLNSPGMQAVNSGAMIPAVSSIANKHNPINDVINNNPMYYAAGLVSGTAAQAALGAGVTKALSAADETFLTDEIANSVDDFYRTMHLEDTVSGAYNGGAGKIKLPEPPKPASLSNTETRRWYLDAEAIIPDLIDRTKPLEQQAKQASSLRNQIRTLAREAMIDKEAANTLFGSKPNMTWEQVVDKYTKLGFSGEELYDEIIRAATRSNPQENEFLNVFPK